MQKKPLKSNVKIGVNRGWLSLKSVPGVENETRNPIHCTNSIKYEVNTITIPLLQMTSPSWIDFRIRIKPSTKKQIDMNMTIISPASKYTVDNQTALVVVLGASASTKYSGITEIVVRSVNNTAPPIKTRLKVWGYVSILISAWNISTLLATTQYFIAKSHNTRLYATRATYSNE